MDDDRRFYERPAFWPRLIGGIFLLVFVIAFRAELLIVLKILLAIVRLILSRTVMNLPRETPAALIVLLVNLIIYVCVYFISLKWISLFVLPAQDAREKQKVYRRLVDYVMGLHGAAVFVKNGEIIMRKDEELKNEEIVPRSASLAFMDLTSAIVAENMSRPSMSGPDNSSHEGVRFSPVRALGPGIGFLDPGERIRGSVDLRRQYRTIKGVHGFTSDGIELETDVNVVMSLGQLPETMLVFDSRGHGIRRLNVDWETGKISTIGKIDQADASEILANQQNHRPGHVSGKPFQPPVSNRPPYSYVEDHIISAVISQPRNTSDGKLEKWFDLPAQVAVTVLLDELSRVSYDKLYSLDSPDLDCYLYKTFKPEFKQKVKEMGVFSYQFVQRKDGRIPNEGDLFNPPEYLFWDVQQLCNSKPIRDRGIKVIEVGFSDFKPIDNSVPEQHFETWRARWQKKAELTSAEYDLEVMRKMNHARAHAQREIIYNLSQIFKLPGYTQDAMAIRIFQALESAAANPATNRLLPRDTVDMLRNFQRILFAQGREGQPPDDMPPKGGNQDS